MDLRKLIKVISELQVDKNHNNNFGKYKYRNAEDILAALKPLIAKYGIFPVITDAVELVGDRYYIKATVTVYDADTGEKLAENSAYAREALSKKGMDEAQVTGASSSYARKYALAGMFNLSPAQSPDELEPPVQTPPTQAPQVQEYRPVYSMEQLIEMLARRGIDAGDFCQLVFHCTAADMTPRKIDSTMERFENAVEKYMELDAHR